MKISDEKTKIRVSYFSFYRRLSYASSGETVLSRPERELAERVSTLLTDYQLGSRPLQQLHE